DSRVLNDGPEDRSNNITRQMINSRRHLFHPCSIVPSSWIAVPDVHMDEGIIQPNSRKPHLLSQGSHLYRIPTFDNDIGGFPKHMLAPIRTTNPSIVFGPPVIGGTPVATRDDYGLFRLVPHFLELFH